MSDEHSGRPIEDGIDWSLQADPASTAALMVNGSRAYNDEALEMVGAVASSVECSQLVIHGTHDNICHYRWGETLSDLTGSPLHTIEGGGCCPQIRYPPPTTQRSRIPEVIARRPAHIHRCHRIDTCTM